MVLECWSCTHYIFVMKYLLMDYLTIVDTEEGLNITEKLISNTDNSHYKNFKINLRFDYSKLFCD